MKRFDAIYNGSEAILNKSQELITTGTLMYDICASDDLRALDLITAEGMNRGDFNLEPSGPAKDQMGVEFKEFIKEA